MIPCADLNALTSLILTTTAWNASQNLQPNVNS
jgi:hypothetical protein